MTVQLLILKVRAAAARSASGGSTRPPAGSKHSHQNKLLVVSDVAFQERLFPRSNELLLCATHGCCLFSVLSHSVSLAFVFYAVYLQAQKPLWRLNFSVGLILAEACKAFIEDKVSFWRKMPLREPNCTEYVTQTSPVSSQPRRPPAPFLPHDIAQRVWDLWAFLQGVVHAPEWLLCSCGCHSRSHFPSSRQCWFLGASLVSWAKRVV